MTDYDEQWLREGLASAVPEPPTNPDRARAAERLARRRRRTTVAAVAAAASVVLIGGISAVVAGGGPERDTGPADPDPVEDVKGHCPPVAKPQSDDFFDEPDPALPGEVPEGAVWVRICAGNGNRLDVPADALVGGVDELTEKVNTLPREENLICTEELGYGYRLVFGGYADRREFVVSGGLYGCGYVTVGSDQRTGAEDLLRTFGDLLREDRSMRRGGQYLPPTGSSIPCDKPTTPAVARPEDVGVAVLCVRTDLRPSGEWLRADVSSEDLEVLREDFRQGIGNHGWPRCGASAEIALVGLTEWGEQVTLPPVCGISLLGVNEPWGAPGFPRSWQPGDEARAILDRLVDIATGEALTGLTCPSDRNATGVVAQLPAITSAILCNGADDPDPTPIPDAELATLVDDMVQNVGGPAVLDCLELSIIVAETSDGEQMVLPATCRAYAIDDDTAWHPSKEAWRVLRRIAERAR